MQTRSLLIFCQNALVQLEAYLERVIFTHDIEEVFQLDLQDWFISLQIINEDHLFICYDEEDLCLDTWEDFIKNLGIQIFFLLHRHG